LKGYLYVTAMFGLTNDISSDGLSYNTRPSIFERWDLDWTE